MQTRRDVGRQRERRASRRVRAHVIAAPAPAADERRDARAGAHRHEGGLGAKETREDERRAARQETRGGGVAAAARAARAASTTGGSSANSASPFDAHEGFEIDRAAAREAGKVAEQLLGALGRLARSDADDAWRAPGVGEGDPTGPVFPFLLGEGVDEVGALLAMAYPDRVGVRRSGRGAFQLSGGSGAANVPDSDPLSREAILAVAELSGDVAGGARNDRARLAAPVPASALEPGGCLHEHLCETRDRVAWAVASKAVVARRLLAVGEAVLRETPYAPEPEDTVPAMLEGVRAMARAPLWVGRTTRKNGGGG